MVSAVQLKMAQAGMARLQLPRLLRFFSTITKVDSLLNTSLHGFHIEQGGRMVPFAGWSMPAVYEDLSIVQSVTHTRNNLSLFDVSHMLQIEVSGKDAEQFLETIMVSDLQALKIGKGTLSLITNDDGGIVDDCIITRTGPKSFYVVANAACAEKDNKYFKEQLDIFKQGSSAVTISTLDEMALIALQGPMLNAVMEGLVKDGDIRKLYFMNSAMMNIDGIEGCRVTRCGYTGEDGIEISVPASRAVELCSKMLKNDLVRLAGLGCRDILRTEAGLCLYGNEMSEDISPVEAGLAWCIGKRRRRKGGFCGSKVILDQLNNGVHMTRIGLASQGAVLRQHCKVMDDNGLPIGHITSGCPSPTMGCNIAMAYVPIHVGITGNKVHVQVRNRSITAEVTTLPFVSCTYYRKS